MTYPQPPAWRPPPAPRTSPALIALIIVGGTVLTCGAFVVVARLGAATTPAAPDAAAAAREDARASATARGPVILGDGAVYTGADALRTFRRRECVTARSDNECPPWAESVLAIDVVAEDGHVAATARTTLPSLAGEATPARRVCWAVQLAIPHAGPDELLANRVTVLSRDGHTLAVTSGGRCVTGLGEAIFGR